MPRFMTLKRTPDSHRRAVLGCLSAVLCLAAASEVAWADTAAAENEPPPLQRVAPPPPDQIPEIDPIELYGGDLVFDVYRKGSKVGEHRVTFNRTGDRLEVATRFNLAVNFLFFRAYTFEYEATEIWDGDSLTALTSLVDDNGKVASVVARTEDGLFKLEGPRGPALASSWVFPTNHWHRGQVNSRTVLNTINGRLTRVEPVRNGIERIETAQGAVDAEHFTYTGELRDTDVWYDQAGRWVKMAFKAKDGSVIEYRCRQCGLGSAAPGQMEAAIPQTEVSSDLAEATSQ